MVKKTEAITPVVPVVLEVKQPRLAKITMVVELPEGFYENCEEAISHVGDEFRSTADSVFVNVTQFDIESVG